MLNFGINVLTWLTPQMRRKKALHVRRIPRHDAPANITQIVLRGRPEQGLASDVQDFQRALLSCPWLFASGVPRLSFLKRHCNNLTNTSVLIAMSLLAHSLSIANVFNRSQGSDCTFSTHR
jgi:hypothetical protein